MNGNRPSRPPRRGAIPADVARAEHLLFELATALVRAPVHATLRLQVRALEIKRVVARWRTESEDDATRNAVIREILTLQGDVRAACLDDGGEHAPATYLDRGCAR